MQFILPALALAITGAHAVQLFFDPVYDNPDGSLSTVACSDGANGLLTRNFTTFSSLPTFPNVGGGPDILAWNSANCGTCFNLTFTPDGGSATTITYTAIDVGGSGFVGSQAALDTLTGGQAEQVGVVDVEATPLDASACGL